MSHLEYSSIQESFPGAPLDIKSPRPNNGWYTPGGGSATGCVAVEPTAAGWARQLQADGALPAAARQYAVTGFRPGNNRPDVSGLVACGGNVAGGVGADGGPVMSYCLPRSPAAPFDPQPWNLVYE